MSVFMAIVALTIGALYIADDDCPTVFRAFLATCWFLASVIWMLVSWLEKP